MNQRLITGLICLFIVSFPMVAQADDTGDIDVEQPDDAERAQRYFDQGAQLYYESQYSAAIVEFRKAHNAHPHPLFLYNIAVSSRNLGRHRDAIEAARQAEAMDVPLEPGVAARTRSVILGSQTVLEAQSVAEGIERHRLDKPPAAVADDGTFGTLGWAGGAALGAGVVALGGAAMTDLRVRSRWDDVEAGLDQMDDATFDDEVASIERRQSFGRMLLYSGAGLAVVGGSLLTFDLLSGSNDEPGRVEVGPTLSGPGFEVSVAW